MYLPAPVHSSQTRHRLPQHRSHTSSATASDTGDTVEDPSTSTMPSKDTVSELLVDETSSEEHAIIAKRKVIPRVIINLLNLKLLTLFLYFVNNFT